MDIRDASHWLAIEAGSLPYTVDAIDVGDEATVADVKALEKAARKLGKKFAAVINELAVLAGSYEPANGFIHDMLDDVFGPALKAAEQREADMPRIDPYAEHRLGAVQYGVGRR